MAKTKCLIFLFLLTCVIVESSVRRKRIVGGNEVDTPPLPTVALEQDRLGELDESESTANNITVVRRQRNAKFKGTLEPEGYHAFYGIRYAEPPVGKLRFQRPQFLKPTGEIDATKPGSPCIQPSADGQRVVGSEDCLYLNVFSPQLPSSEGGSPDFPVLMWIHGGGFRRGSASQYVPTDLVKKGLVVVTVNYRLGSLGFLSIQRNELPGNTALFDLSAAVEWIQKYIVYFGGNPKRIVPAGQGSGASAATMLPLTGLTQSSIAGIFAMSGSSMSSFAVDPEPKKSLEKVSAIDGCNVESDSLQFVRCMQQLPVESIINGDNNLQNDKLKDKTPESYITSLSSLLSPGPAVERENDDRFLPYFLHKAPIDTMKEGYFSNIPLLTGVTKEETSTSVKGGLATQLLQQLEAVPDFLEKSLVPNLLSINTGLFSQGQINPLLDSLFKNNNYLKAVTSTLEGVASTADKAIEVTTDALFNLPAFMTSLYWTKKNKAYMYSFEHDSSKSTSQDFLDGLPLVETEDKFKPVEGAGHGDDLVYLFDVRSIDGAPLPYRNRSALSDPKDLQVRDHYTTMVAEFAKTGTPRVGGQEWNSFSADGDYLKITDKPTVEKGFRKCQMGLWAGLPELLNSAECSFLGVGELVTNFIGSGATGLFGPKGLAGLKDNTLFKTASNIAALGDGLPVQGIPAPLPVPGLPSGLFGSGSTSSSTGIRRTTSSSTGIRRTTAKPSLINSFSGFNLG